MPQSPRVFCLTRWPCCLECIMGRILKVHALILVSLSVALPATARANLLLDPSFENNSGSWSLSGPAVYQSAEWAASAGDKGVWFRGFDPGNVQLTQNVSAPTTGDYVLLFDSRVEENFKNAASSFDVSLSGPGGTVTKNLYSSAGPDFRPYTVTLPNVSAGQTLTVEATSQHAGGSGPQRSAFVDNFYLGAATNLRSTPLFDGERGNFDSSALINNWGGGFNAGSTNSITLQSAVKHSGDNAYRVDLPLTASGQSRFFQTFATELKSIDRRNTRDLSYFEQFETYVRNDTGANLTFTIELKDYRDSLAHSATKDFVVPSGSTWTKISTPLDLGAGWNVNGSPQLDQTYAMSFVLKPNGQSASGSVYLDDARLIEPGPAINPLTAPIHDIAEALAKRTFHSLWGQRSRQSGIVPNTSVDADTGALNTTSGLLWALPSAVQRGWVSQGEANAYVSQLADTLNHTMDQTSYLPSRFVDLPTGDAGTEESSIDAAFIAIGMHLYKNQPGLDPTLANKVHQTVNRFNFAAFEASDGWRLAYSDAEGFSPHRYKGFTSEGKTISLAAELSDSHHVALEEQWHSDTFRTFDHLADPELEAMVYGNEDHRAPFSLALINLFLDMSDRGVDNYPVASQRVNPWHNFQNYEADSAEHLANLDRPYFFQPDAARGGPPSGYKAYSLYNLYPAGSVTNEDLFMPWSSTLALLSGSPEAELALRFLLQNDMHGPLGMPDGARWQTGASDPSQVNALQDNWNLSLSLMALMRYLDGVDGGARFLADLPQVADALDALFFAPTSGDYNLDGSIDQRDFERWKQAYGSGDLSADGNGDRVVDAADYLIWRAAFASQGAGPSPGPVPEPGTLLLAGIAVLAWATRRRS